jgi:ABC-type dipeptide/oligopeptide/nickel transport systems, permease components
VVAYVIRRLFYMAVTLAIISVIVFAIIQLPPGDYLTSYILQLQSSGQIVDAELVESLKRRYGLDQPYWMQYLKWVTGLFRGDFGRSFEWNRPVADLIAERLPMTIVVSLCSLVFAYLVGIFIGIISAVYKYSIIDYVATFIGFVGLATPNFLLALVLMFAFYQWFGISVGGLFSPEMEDAPWSWAKFVDLINHLWIPVIVIGTAGTASTVRVMRATLLDELGRDYVKIARSKGLPGWRVVYHAFRVAINPIISTIGWELPVIVSGAEITSIVLNLPTTGPLLLQALQTQDMFLAGSFILMLSVLTVVGTLISDILLAVVDPRIRYS